jgi:hypothetical protein
VRRPAAAAVVAAAVAALAVPSGAALGTGSPASPQASCVATITSYEASQLQPGSVGAEVSGLATSARGLGRDLVSNLAKLHAGSFAGCVAEER